MNLRKLKWYLVAYVLLDLLIGYAGVFPLTNLAAAQFTTVTGTVVDPNGIAYANGTIVSVLILPGGTSPTLSGLPYSPPTQPVGLDGTGSFTIQLADNNVLLPANTKWNFTVCSAIGTVQPAGGKGPVCFTLSSPITITGTSQSISTNLQAAALALTRGAAGSDTIVGQGYFFAPYGEATLSNNLSAVIGALSGANVVRAGMIHIPYALTFTKVSINVTTTSNGNHYYIGLYSAGKNLIQQASFTLGAGTGVLTVTVPSTAITPGAYYLAWSADNTIAIVQGTATNATAAGAVYKASFNYIGASGNSTSGGVMPSSLGTLDGTLFQMPDVMFEP